MISVNAAAGDREHFSHRGFYLKRRGLGTVCNAKEPIVL